MRISRVLSFTLSQFDSEAFAKPPDSYGLFNRMYIIYFDEIAKIESLIENVQNLDQHQV